MFGQLDASASDLRKTVENAFLNLKQKTRRTVPVPFRRSEPKELFLYDSRLEFAV